MQIVAVVSALGDPEHAYKMLAEAEQARRARTNAA
jgi:hypothetical protein